MVAPERDYSPYNIKDIDRPVILERMISAPGKSRPAQVPGLQHSRNIVAPATFRPAQHDPGQAVPAAWLFPHCAEFIIGAGPPGPASGRPDGRLRPDPVAPCGLRINDEGRTPKCECLNFVQVLSV